MSILFHYDDREGAWRADIHGILFIYINHKENNLHFELHQQPEKV